MPNSLEGNPDLNIKKPEEFSSVERVVPIPEQANFKGNYSELLFSRMQNPVIRKQLLDLKEANEKWMAEHPPMEKVYEKDPKTGGIMLGRPTTEIPRVYNPKSRKDLEDDLDEALKIQMAVTRIDPNVDFTKSNSDVSDMYQSDDSVARTRFAKVGTFRQTTDPLTENEIRMRSETEAHEKGHVFRHLTASGYLRDKFAPAFDPSRLDAVKHAPNKMKRMSKEQAEKEITEYLFNFERPSELIERMSQLKGYFGMKGDEKFTPQHLDYAREHYLKDGMHNNNMQEFFDSITPQTEFTFLKLINSVGV